MVLTEMMTDSKNNLGGGGSGTPANSSGKNPQSSEPAVRPSFPFPERQVATKTGVSVRELAEARKGLVSGQHWALERFRVVYSQTGVETIAAALNLPAGALLELLRKNPAPAPLPDRRVSVVRLPTSKNPHLLHCADAMGEVWVRIQPAWLSLFKPSQKLTAKHDPDLNTWHAEKPRKKSR